MRLKLAGALFLVLIGMNVFAKIPNDREQYLKLGELLELINNFFDAGLNYKDFQVIHLKDGNRIITLTQFDKLFEYIQNEVPVYNDEVKNVKFKTDQLSLNSYEYVKNIIDAKMRELENIDNPSEKIYLTNHQLFIDMDKKGNDRLATYR